MRKTVIAALFAPCLLFGGAAQGETPLSAPEAVAARHMTAQAMLTAHYVAAALEAGKSADEINAVLAEIADQTVIAEFWVSDAEGRIAFTNLPGTGFVFPTDPKAQSQAAPFARLLTGGESVVAQGVRERALDGKRFMYVGVAGADGSRIVQVGLEAAAVGE